MKRSITRLLVPILLMCTVGAAQDAPFVREALPVNSYKIFDFGVVDANGDGHLDVFTTNCQARAGVLFANGRGGFRTSADDWGLQHTPRYPGFAMAANPPEFTRPGLYVYMLFRSLHLRAYRLDEAQPIAGSVQLISTAVVTERHGADIDVTRGRRPDGQEITRIEFSFTDDGEVVIVPNMITGPMEFDFRNTDALPLVYLGADGAHPESPRVAFDFHDSHGLAWSDVTGDGKLDVFMSTGALQARPELAAKISGLRDRLLAQYPAGLSERDLFEGIDKSGCAGRGVAWVDFDLDGDLDLFVTCARDTRSKLYRRDANDRFTDIAESVGLGSGDEGFLWLDFDSDGDPDLMTNNSKGIWLYVNDRPRGEFHASLIVGGSAPEKFTVSDIDGDGDPDVFAAAREPTSYLLVNLGDGRFDVRGPESTGLPPRALTAQWVDFDNDGAAELYILPSGLHRMRADGRFDRLRILDDRLPEYHSAKSIAHWFDADADGDLDLATAIRLQEERWDTALWRNQLPTSNWLEVDLVGPPGNREAIGARVSVTTDSGVLRRWVGDADGSLGSQGHYRLYFGFGSARPRNVNVDWPGAQATSYDIREYNRRITFRFDGH